jgi:hypothetical protein
MQLPTLKHPRLYGLMFALGLAGTAACTSNVLSGDPDIATMYVVLPGNDTVTVNTETGEVTPGAITIVGDTDFSTAFFTEDGVPDGRVTETDYILEIAITNTSFVTFLRDGAFTGTFDKIAPGSTDGVFTLRRYSDNLNVMTVTVPIDVF